jgi:hypothetical protein
MPFFGKNILKIITSFPGHTYIDRHFIKVFEKFQLIE